MSLTNKQYTDLTEYTELEGSEVGEMCNLLLQLHNYTDYFSDEFKEALEIEMKNQLKNFKDKCKIVKREIKSVQIVKELEWI